MVRCWWAAIFLRVREASIVDNATTCQTFKTFIVRRVRASNRLGQAANRQTESCQKKNNACQKKIDAARKY